MHIAIFRSRCDVIILLSYLRVRVQSTNPQLPGYILHCSYIIKKKMKIRKGCMTAECLVISSLQEMAYMNLFQKVNGFFCE